jgi:hypothetical protein
VDLDGGSERFLDEAVTAKALGEIECKMEDDDEDAEMVQTYAMGMSVGSSQYELAATSLAQCEGETLLYNAGYDTDDTFDDEGIPELRAELADVDHRLSRDPIELERRLKCDSKDDRTERSTFVLADDDGRTQRSSDMFEDELVSDNSGDDDGSQTTEDDDEEEIVQDVAEPQPIRFERQTQEIPEYNPTRLRCNSTLQDAFLL